MSCSNCPNYAWTAPLKLDNAKESPPRWNRVECGETTLASMTHVVHLKQNEGDVVYCGMQSLQLYDIYAVPLCTFDHLDQHCQAASSFPYGLPKSLWPVLPYVPIACHVLCRPVPAISSLSQTSQSCTLTRPSTLQLSKTGWLRPAVSCSVTQFQGFRQSWIFEIRTGYGKASLFMSWVVFDKIWKPMFILHDNYLLG